MKKVFAMILTLCMMLSMLSVTAFASDAEAATESATEAATETATEAATEATTAGSSEEPPAQGTVLRVRGQKSDKKIVKIQDYDNFENGWNAAMEYAIGDNYIHIFVDFYADWKATDGEFTHKTWNGKGFNWDAIYFQPGVYMTINLNGHTIDRGLTEWEHNGEVMYIDSRAHVTINGGKDENDPQTGKITGGFSCNGAGGIHVNSNAELTLNNVNIDGNRVEDDDGAGIAIYSGATLIMNGGSIANNLAYESNLGCGIYVENGDATLKNVLISGNKTYTDYVGRGSVTSGGAGYVSNGKLTLEGCTVKDNHSDRLGGAFGICFGEIIIRDCTVTQNSAGIDGSVVAIDIGTCTIENSDLTGNVNTKYDSVFFVDKGNLLISNSKYDNYIRNFSGTITLTGIQENPVTPGAILGEGSIAIIISVAALVISISVLIVAVVSGKKKALVSGATGETNSDDE